MNPRGRIFGRDLDDPAGELLGGDDPVFVEIGARPCEIGRLAVARAPYCTADVSRIKPIVELSTEIRGVRFVELVPKSLTVSWRVPGSMDNEHIVSLEFRHVRRLSRNFYSAVKSRNPCLAGHVVDARTRAEARLPPRNRRISSKTQPTVPDENGARDESSEVLVDCEVDSVR